MKNILALAFLTLTISSFGQSESFLTLKEKFEGENVKSLNVGGFLLRTALWIARESDFKEEFGSVRSVRLITIPQHEFVSRKLKVSGFKKVLAKDGFDEMVSAKQNGALITVYMQDQGKRDNLYFVLVENDQDITAIEIKGLIDPKKLIESNSKERITSL